MPSRNIEKYYVEDGFYHIYNRGVNKRRIFLDNSDYAVFLNLLKRYLDEKPAKDKKGREYNWLHNEMDLLAFCLMPNHFHLLICQSNPTAMTTLMRGVCTSYTRYFNKRYKRVGPLFIDRFKASLINKDAYLQHISRYIHLNPKDYKAWPYSSLGYYTGKQHAAWLKPDFILDIFSGEVEEYMQFLADYEDHKVMLDELYSELADQ